MKPREHLKISRDYRGICKGTRDFFRAAYTAEYFLGVKRNAKGNINIYFCEILENDDGLDAIRNEERDAVMKLDATCSELWWIISSTWLTEWHNFLGDGPRPGPILNFAALLTPELKPKTTPRLRRSKHYRGVN